MARLRRSFNTDFKREAANLVLKESYSVAEICRLIIGCSHTEIGVSRLFITNS